MLIMGPACIFGPLQTGGFIAAAPAAQLILESPEEGILFTFPNWDAYLFAAIVAGGIL